MTKGVNTNEDICMTNGMVDRDCTIDGALVDR